MLLTASNYFINYKVPRHVQKRFIFKRKCGSKNGGKKFAEV